MVTLEETLVEELFEEEVVEEISTAMESVTRGASEFEEEEVDEEFEEEEVDEDEVISRLQAG
jgi:hypothetical protein